MTVDSLRLAPAAVVFSSEDAVTADHLATPLSLSGQVWGGATDTDESGGMWLHLLQRWLDRGRSARHLACVPDHTLRDIGLDKTMIGQPVWPPRKLGDAQD